MAIEEKPPPRIERVWKWWCRGLASALTIYLVLGDGISAPLVPLLIGLFFGPEILAGQISINRKHRDEE